VGKVDGNDEKKQFGPKVLGEAAVKESVGGAMDTHLETSGVARDAT
jgi:hypothetical protein